MKNFLFIMFLLIGCSNSTMSFLTDGSCGEEEEQAACNDSDGVWESSDKECPEEDHPVNLGHCTFPNGTGYLVCAEECYQ